MPEFDPPLTWHQWIDWCMKNRPGLICTEAERQSWARRAGATEPVRRSKPFVKLAMPTPEDENYALLPWDE